MSRSTFSPAINFAIAGLTAVYAASADVAQGDACAGGASDADLSTARPFGIALYWTGDNLGCHDGEVIVSGMAESDEVAMPLEEALRRIDEFVEPGSTRILSRLAMHFGVVDMQTYAQRGDV